MNAPKIMVFRPTMEEFKDFSRYIQYMESQGAHLAGIAKVIPPKEWVPRKSYDNIDNLVIPAPIEQVVSGQKGLFTQYNIQRKPVTVKEFRRLTNTPRYEPPFYESYSELERVYWKNITFNSAIYGADISGSLYDENVEVWNVARLNTLLDVIERDSGVKIEGVNTAYLYFGMWKTTFAWHTEDMDLYSINYVHFGAPKSWYAIPPEHGKRLERLAAGFYPNDKSNCSSFLRHKMTLISPFILRQYGIPVDKVTQEAGEFIITFPYGYHAGFNHGFNCAESTNFASERWINYGKSAEKCTCRNDTVTIDMDLFVQLFQPEQYESWKTKKNETKLCYHEIPLAPDMNKPFPSWKTRVEEFRRLHDISTFLKKITKPRKDKTTSKHKTSGSISPKKSSQKNKKMKEKRPIINSAKLQQVIQKVDCTPIVRGGIKQESIPSTSSQDPSSLITSASDYPVDLPSSYTIPKTCLFDRVKTGTRRKSSAKAISSEDDAERTLNKHSITDSSLISSMEEGTASKSILQLNSDLSSASCSVQCEHISNLPLEILSKNPLVVKDSGIPAQSSLKRRHPVTKKVPKKTSPNILVKRGHCGVDGESVPVSKKEKKERKPEGKPCFKDELLYNETIARHFPHCAVCSLFKPYHLTPQTDVSTVNGIPASIPPAPPGRPKHVAGDRTAPLIPEVSFASNVNNPSPLAECQLLDKDGKSPLLQCCVCQVQVHASCYGVVDPPESENTSGDDVNAPVWTCNRCSEKTWNARCSLCCNRGGALKRISTGLNWAHVVCAIAIPEVYFEDTVRRSGINVSKLPAKRLKLKCVYRKKSHRCSGVCLQCCSGRCTVAFHATCAHAAGIPIEPGNWPFPVYVHCHKHTMLRTKGKVEPQKAVEVDRYVLAKHKNGKYYHAVVKKLKKETFYKVNFKDNSWSDNLYSQDLVSHDWSSGESPVVGSMVEVKWTDGEIYEAEYRGNSVQETIQVEFEDGLLIDFERNEIFTEDDPMPSNIRRKLRSQSASLKPAYE